MEEETTGTIEEVKVETEAESATGEDKADRRGVLIGLAVVVAFFIALIVLFACSRPSDVVTIGDPETPLSSGKPAATGADEDDEDEDTGKDGADGKDANPDGADALTPDGSAEGAGEDGGSGSGVAGSGSGGTGGSGSGSTGGSSGGGTTTPTDPNAGKTWHPAWDETVWVVDVPGHNDEVYHQKQGHYADKCNICGAELGPGLAGQHLLDTGHASYGTAWFTDVPAWTEYVWVPESRTLDDDTSSGLLAIGRRGLDYEDH